MAVDREQVRAVVRRVLREMDATPQPSRQRGVFDSVDDAHLAARSAHHKLKMLPLSTRRAMLDNIRTRCRQQVDVLSVLAVEETGLGRVEDKKRKNRLVIDKTPGIEILKTHAVTGDDGLMLTERAPFGVIASITPCTNPTETIINNGIGMIAGGNAVVFNTHPAAKGVSASVIDLINAASVAVGGPDNVVTCIAEPTIASAQALMTHPRTDLVVVTGGGGVVNAAMRSGKKCVAAGPGNPPVLVDETADIDQAAQGIYAGASLDNNIICTDEKEVFAVDAVFDALMARLQGCGAVKLSPHQIERLENLILTADRTHTDRTWVGKDASVYLRALDLPVSGDPRLIVCDVPADHPFVQLELLMPIIGVVRVPDVEAGIQAAVQAEHGFRHTASMYSKNIDALDRMARAADTSIFIKNAPNFAGLGLGGEGYTSFTIASPTGDGLTTAMTFTRQRRCTLAGHFRIV
ncbi:MAG: aldehyde dehydrogenase family protein [Myxococcota bacterium]